MQIKVQNLGPIKEAKIKICPLTVFVGPNNSGKTWTAYLFAGIAGPYGWKKFCDYYSESNSVYPILDEIITDIIEKGSAKIDILDFIENYGEHYLNDAAKLSAEWFGEFIGSESISLKDFTLSIYPEFEKMEIKEAILDATANAKFANGALTALKEAGDPAIHFYTSGEGRIDDVIPLTGIKENVSQIVLQVIQRAVYYNTDWFFPPERTVFTQLSIIFRGTITKGNECPTTKHPIQKDTMNDDTMWRLPYPIGSFYSMMNAILSKGNISQRISDCEKDPSIKDYIEIADILEKSILGVNIELFKQEPNPLSNVLFQYSNDGKLDIAVVSSMIKELASLILYLRYKATAGDLLVIDEPEMHLHPEAQIRMAEALALMVNKGLNVIITTHSPYIIDHLANLMKAASRDDKDRIINLFGLRNKDAFIQKDKVSVHLFKDGSVSNILEEDGHIDWKTFSDVSEQLSEIYFKI